MEILIVGHNGEKVVIKIVGNIKTQDVPSFEISIMSLINQNLIRIAIDASDIRYASSAFLEAIIRLQELAEQRNGKLIFYNPSKLITETIGIFNESRLIEQDRIVVFKTMVGALLDL